jgi:hypothetical protein
MNKVQVIVTMCGYISSLQQEAREEIGLEKCSKWISLKIDCGASVLF